MQTILDRIALRVEALGSAGLKSHAHAKAMTAAPAGELLSLSLLPQPAWGERKIRGNFCHPAMPYGGPPHAGCGKSDKLQHSTAAKRPSDAPSCFNLAMPPAA
jgi:hypothetical protein